MSFLKISIRRFKEYKLLAEKALTQLSDDALLQDADSQAENSLVVIIKHLNGNMLSRWTNFLTEDGEKPWRARDGEFEYQNLSRTELMKLWDAGWERVFATLELLSEDDLSHDIHIRGEAMSAMDGIVRQLMHYAYHVGQIILLCKQKSGGTWQSLSIPRGGTAAFNAAFLAQQASGDSNR